ncbi:MAG: MFS transporter [Acidobacteria bacterium]|nr:MFS transporter [Acidobacteriota bacterium]
MAPDEITGTQMWTRGVAASSVLIAIFAPLVGTIADRSASRRRYFVGLTLVTIVLTVALAFIGPPYAILALAVFIIANTAYELAQVFYNSFLPALSTDKNVGMVSGAAWGLGYVGGLLCLAAGFLFTGIPGVEWKLPLSTEGGWNIRATNLLVAGWYLLFALPSMFLLREPAPPDPRASWNPLPAARQLLAFPQALRLLVARLIYNDGLVAAFSFGGIYAGVTFGFDFGQIILFGIWLNAAAGIGAFLFGKLDDIIGGKRTIQLSLIGLVGAAIGAGMAPDAAGLWIAGTALGLLVGPNQSASRSLMARFIPAEKTGEFFGLFALSGKLTAFLGPLVLGEVTGLTGSQRWGVGAVSIFFLIGLVLLYFVDERRGIDDVERFRTNKREESTFS